MGWTYRTKPENVKQFLNDSLTWTNSKTGADSLVLAAKIVRFREYYAAVQTTKPDGECVVWAAAYMLDFVRDQTFNFGYKDMDETMGPNIDCCPKSILERLTPTLSEYANNWRARCWARINRRQKQPRLVKGLAIQLESPLTFQDNVTLERLIVSSVKPLRFIRQDGRRGIYRISRQRLCDIGYKSIANQ